MITKERLQVAIRQRKGFTLIEILIVVAIIAILASVVLVGLGPTQQSGRDARRVSDLRETQNALELYYNLCGYYPGTVEAAAPCGSWSETDTWTGSGGLTASLTGSAIGVTSVPNDPSAGHTYYYDTNNGGSSYIIAAKLENTNNAVFNGYVAPSESGITNLGVTCTDTGVYCLSL